MKKINVVMSYMVGGALTGMKRISSAMPQYDWIFTTNPVQSDMCIYMNDHKHYLSAKKLGIKHIVQRKTGIRSLKVQEPSDLSAVICASERSYNNSKHPKKTLIYNGVDLGFLKTIKPEPNIDLVIAESRIGKGQAVEKSIQYALKNKRDLTILGSGEGLAESTYRKLKKKYPQFNWVGRVPADKALSYIKGSNGIIISNPSHGIANQVIEALAMDKPIINLGGVEVPPKSEIDINITVQKYNSLIKSILYQP